MEQRARARDVLYKGDIGNAFLFWIKFFPDIFFCREISLGFKVLKIESSISLLVLSLFYYITLFRVGGCLKTEWQTRTRRR